MDCRFVVVFLFCASLALAQVPPYYGRVGVPGAGAYVGVPILVQNYDLNPDGSYTFNYEAADGSSRDEAGVVKGVGPEGPILGVQGNYRYVSPDGPVAVSYIADENGYQPTGDSVHPSIQKAVAYQVAQAQANPAVPGVAGVPGYYGNPFRRY